MSGAITTPDAVVDWFCSLTVTIVSLRAMAANAGKTGNRELLEHVRDELVVMEQRRMKLMATLPEGL
jgi:hypothetical protein